MSLTLIGTPIGNPKDITLRALEALEKHSYIIAEETKILRRRLSSWSISPQDKIIYNLNEHSSAGDLKELTAICDNQDVCLVSDCGTPSFFDPGFQLINLCREKKIAVNVLPGVSSLTALMPFLPIKTESFNVVGFPPREEHERVRFFKKLSKSTKPFFLMDTPYRLQKTFSDLKNHLPNSFCVLGLNLTCQNEKIFYGSPDEVSNQISHYKKENFVCMIYYNESFET